MVRLPAEYQEVEYLESSRGEYIELSFGFDSTDEIELRGAITQISGDKYMVSPKVWNNDNNRFSMLGTIGGVGFVFAFGTCGTPNNRLTPAVSYDVNFHTITYANKVFTFVDVGSVADMSADSFGSTTANLRLFYGYNSATMGKIAYYHHKKADGTEVNLIPCYRKSDNEPGMYDLVSNQFYTNSGSGTFLIGDPVYYDTASLLERRRQILLNTPHIKTVSDSAASFKTDIATDLKGLKVYFSPVQEGTGDPSPDNVRPITGWDGIEVTVCGKNLIDPSQIENGNITSSGTLGKLIGFVRTGLIPVKYGKVYNLSGISTYGGSTYLRAHGYDQNGTWIKQINSYSVGLRANYSFSVSIDDEHIKCVRFSVAESNDFQFELGSTATEYEPYTATTLTIPFNRTIYGGYVDLVSGEVVETQTKVTLDGNNIKCNAGSYTVTNYYGAGWLYANPAGQSYYQNYDRSLYLCDRLALTTS